MLELPQEIIDAIVDEVWASSCPKKTSTLRSCSRSAKCFLYRTRTHLFHEIHLYHPSCSAPLSQESEDSTSGLHGLLSQFHDVFLHSFIPLECVRSLHLHGNPEGIMTNLEVWREYDPQLSEVLGALGRLECLTFHSFYVPGIDTSVPWAPSVTEVTFGKRMWFANVRRFKDCLRQFPHMESLHLSNSRFLFPESQWELEREAVVDLGSLRALSLEDVHFSTLNQLASLLRPAQLQRLSYQRSEDQLRSNNPHAIYEISRLIRAFKSVTDLTVNLSWLTVYPSHRPPLLSLSNLTSLNVTLLIHALKDFKHHTESIQFCDTPLASFLLDSLSVDTTYSLETFTLSLDRVWYHPDIPQDHRDLWGPIGNSLASPLMPYLARVRVVDRKSGRPVWLCSTAFQAVKETPGFALLERRRILDMEEPAEWEKNVSPWCMG